MKVEIETPAGEICLEDIERVEFPENPNVVRFIQNEGFLSLYIDGIDRFTANPNNEQQTFTPTHDTNTRKNNSN